MRSLLVCPDDFLFRLLRGTPTPGEPPLYLVEDRALRARIARRGAAALAGDLEDPALYRRAFRTGRESVLLAVPHERPDRVLEALRTAAPQAPVVVLKDDARALDPAAPGVTALSAGTIGERVIPPELERAALRARVDRLRAHLASAERLLILLQDDPDPDAIASALALRTLVGRNRTGAPICTFGTITRPENLAMCKILEIDVEPITTKEMHAFDRVAMVDVQPSFLEERFVNVDLVIDHHPIEEPVRADIRDVRPSYGATSTILVEYLRAADVKISQRLATALLYGIKADTLGLERGGTKADLEVFTYLYLLANHNALRRIERPALGEAALDTLATGLAKRRIT